MHINTINCDGSIVIMITTVIKKILLEIKNLKDKKDLYLALLVPYHCFTETWIGILVYILSKGKQTNVFK